MITHPQAIGGQVCVFGVAIITPFLPTFPFPLSSLSPPLLLSISSPARFPPLLGDRAPSAGVQVLPAEKNEMKCNMKVGALWSTLATNWWLFTTCAVFTFCEQNKLCHNTVM